MSSQGRYGTGIGQSNIQQSRHAGGSSGMSGMNHRSNVMSSQGGYSTGSTQRNTQQSSQGRMSMPSTSQGIYSTGSAQRNTEQSSQGRMSMPSTSQFKLASSESQSKPAIGYLESEFTEAYNSNTVFIQNHGSAVSNGMLNSGSARNNGVQNYGSSSS